MENTEELLNIANNWVDAEKQGDTSFLEGVLTDDFIGIGPLGFLLTKGEWLDRHTAGDLKYESLALEDIKVRLYAGVAILVGAQKQTATYKGNSVDARLRATLVFIKRNEKWQLANLQFSTIGQPPNFAKP
jgi:ketosteroid isomerase-like protein